MLCCSSYSSLLLLKLRCKHKNSLLMSQSNGRCARKRTSRPTINEAWPRVNYWEVWEHKCLLESLQVVDYTADLAETTISFLSSGFLLPPRPRRIQIPRNPKHGRVRGVWILDFFPNSTNGTRSFLLETHKVPTTFPIPNFCTLLTLFSSLPSSIIWFSHFWYASISFL